MLKIGAKRMDWTAAAIVLATFGGPIVAVEIQKRLEMRREKKRLKEAAFRTLMATRAIAHRTSAEHVQVLNGIELTFSGGGKDKAVREAWRAYLDMLNMPDTPDAHANERKYEKRNDAFWDLLYQMNLALGYSFDRTYIKNSCYFPIAHDNTLRDQEIMRSGIVAVLSGKAGLPVVTFSPGEMATPHVPTGLVQGQNAPPETVPPPVSAAGTMALP